MKKTLFFRIGHIEFLRRRNSILTSTLVKFVKSTLENTRIPVSRGIAHDLIIFHKFQNSKENHGLLGVNGSKRALAVATAVGT